MNVAIYGAGDFGKYVKRLIDDHPENGYNVVNFVDNDILKQNSTYMGVKCISIAKMWQEYGKSIDLVLIAIRSALTTFFFIESLLESGKIRNLYMVHPNVLDRKISLFKNGQLNERALIKGPWLSYLEQDIVSHCNLKCDSCSHYCNAVSEPEFYDTAEFEKDMLRLAQLFSQINTIRILGGEPFLHPELPKFVEIARNIFPNSNLVVATNGLLIPKQKPQVWRIFRDARVKVYITQYLPTSKMLDRIKNTLDENYVQYSVSELIKEFGKLLTLHENNNPFETRKTCPKMCTTICKGNLALCPPMLYIDRINALADNFYKLKKEDLIYIHDTNINGWDILHKIANPVDFCKYCTPRKRFEWSANGDVKLNNWVIDTF